MTSGPRPTPRPLRVLRGETAPSRGVPRYEPAPEPGPVQPPPEVTGKARELWDALAPELERSHLLHPRSAQMFAVYCVAMIELWKAHAVLALTGPIVKGKNAEIVSNPASREFARYAELTRRLGAEFGLSPAAVTAIGRHLDGSQRTDALDPARLLSG